MEALIFFCCIAFTHLFGVYFNSEILKSIRNRCTIQARARLLIKRGEKKKKKRKESIIIVYDGLIVPNIFVNS